MTHDGIGKYLQDVVPKAPGPTDDIVEHPARTRRPRRRQLPARRLRRGDEVVRGAGAGGRLRLRQLHPGVHRPRAVLAQALRGARPADHRRRHQVAGRRDDRPPRADAPLPTTAACGWTARTSSTSAATRTSSTCWSASGWSRRRSPRRTPSTSQLDYEMPAGDVHVGPSDHVPWLQDRKWAYIRMEGTTLRQRAAERRAEAGGLGQPELGRRGHRRHPLLQAGARPQASAGALEGPSAYFMKSPPTQYTDDQAREMVESVHLTGSSDCVVYWLFRLTIFLTRPLPLVARLPRRRGASRRSATTSSASSGAR